MLLWITAFAALLVLLGMRIAASPPFAVIGRIFSNWADRCRHGPELI